MELALPWSQFKAHVDTWSIKPLIRYTPKDANNNYLSIWMQWEGMTLRVSEVMLDGSAEMAEFEAGYKTSTTTTYVDGKNVSRKDKAYSLTCEAAEIVLGALTPKMSTLDIPLSTVTFLWGAQLIVPGTAILDNDFLAVKIVDVTGIYAPAGTVLKTTVDKKFIPPTRMVEMMTPNQKPSGVLPGLYARIEYTETNGIAKTLNVNTIEMT